MFKPVSSRVNFPEVERGVLTFWEEKCIFAKSLARREGKPRFVLYEGPPTANGNPGIHHVLARIFKDIIPRYKTMKGYYVPRQAGWDTHGLPVELEVEKELGLSSKAQIEAYGVARFNERCRQSVFRYLKEWEAMTQRIAYWLDMKNAYITFDNSYIESCWWILKQLWDRELIYQGYRVTPHCPRCGTSLSSHEVALGYQDNTEDPSVYVKFKLDEKSRKTLSGDSAAPVFFLAWTTTPWTLPGNTALAVAPGADYSLVELSSGERLLLASALLASSLVGEFRVIANFKGLEMVGLRYEPLYDPYLAGIEVLCFSQTGSQAMVPEEPGGKGEKLTYPVIGGEFVSMKEGTGMVHIAPAFGEADFEAGQAQALCFIQHVDLGGNVAMGQGWSFAGRFVKQADPLIMADLEARGLLYRSGTVLHTYPFCWRCHAPLLYYAKRSWYIKTTAVKQRLVEANGEINWYPEHLKSGRFGDWLENNVDWALSRERYWGTPLNIWRCQNCGKNECVGSIAELRARPGLRGWQEPPDLHRPFMDGVTFSCPHCAGEMQRVPEVADAWFDSGAMPVAQWHYPFENQALFERSFPADYICEAIDQTRGWFYTLHALSVLLFDRPCFKNVICLGHILDAEGEKMSKAKGNVVDPWSVLDKQGADALRWYLFTSAPAGNVRRFSIEGVEGVMRRFLSTLWNCYSFFVTYANIDRFQPGQVTGPSPRSDLDRWLLSELNQVIATVDASLEGYDPTAAARSIDELVDNLSNWYIRRSRRRFWKSENDSDKQAAYATLYHTLVTLAKLLAPFAPFVAEELFQNLVRSVDDTAPESVHLCDFPQADRGQIDQDLTAATRLVMKVCSLGRAARSQAGIKVRQPVARVLVKVDAQGKEELARFETQVLEELNAKSLEFARDEGFPVKEKYETAAEGDLLVAIPTDLSPELLAEGMARELVHHLQNMRRSAGFDIADYIVTYYQADPALEKIVATFGDYIKQETLSRRLVQGPPDGQAYGEKLRLGKIEGSFWLTRE